MKFRNVDVRKETILYGIIACPRETLVVSR